MINVNGWLESNVGFVLYLYWEQNSFPIFCEVCGRKKKKIDEKKKIFSKTPYYLLVTSGFNMGELITSKSRLNFNLSRQNL